MRGSFSSTGGALLARSVSLPPLFNARTAPRGALLRLEPWHASLPSRRGGVTPRARCVDLSTEDVDGKPRGRRMSPTYLLPAVPVRRLAPARPPHGDSPARGDRKPVRP